MSGFLGLATIYFCIKFLDSSLSLSARLHFLFVALVNIWIIQETGSIQGIAIFLSGISFWFLARAYAYRRRAHFVILSLFFALSATTLMAGVYGVGPMGKYLIQETVLFRRDYWIAGLNMLRDNLFTGVGMDSYGDFYREYRDVLAADRTGPQRVANTAHNVFLDVFTGGGLIPGLLFLGCFLFAILMSVRMLRESKVKDQILVLQSLVIGYFVFCAISINQIGVATWGMGFLGLLLGLVRYTAKEEISIKSELNSNSRPKNAKPISKEIGFIKLKLSFIFCLFISCMIPAVSAYSVDAKYFSYSKMRNSEGLSNQAFRFGATVYHKEKLIEHFLEIGDITKALEYARVVVEETNNRSFYALVVVLQRSNDPTERREVASKLQRLDPQNFGRFSLEKLLTD